MRKEHIGVIFGGILLLVIAMGISRFAFTPILPFMRIDEGLSFEDGGLLASSNYFGYFVGALCAGLIYRFKKNILLANVVINVLSILLMGMTHSFLFWLFLRFIAGATSGFIFVLTSSIIMDYLAEKQLSKWAGFLFSGIGIGIALSGLLVPLFEKNFSWERTWINLGFLCLLFFLTTIYLWKTVTVLDREKTYNSRNAKISYGFMPWLIFAYGLEGLGYIITGTFLVDIIYNIESLQAFASFSWVMVGVAAIPAAPLWMTMIKKFSSINVLAIAYVLQIIGIILPVLSQSSWSVLLSAFLFGFTFVGIVSLSTSYARELFPQKSNTVVSALTTAYALGQIIGPILASRLEIKFNTFKAPLTFASLIVTIALIVLLFGKWFHGQKRLHHSKG